jgi:hypothetical protein
LDHHERRRRRVHVLVENFVDLLGPVLDRRGVSIVA